MIDAIDTFLLDRADEYLGFCLGWLGLTKKQVVLIHFYVASISAIAGSIIEKSTFSTIFSILGMSICGLCLHIVIPECDRFDRLFYSALMFTLGISHVFPPHKHLYADILWLVFNVTFITIYYLCSSNRDGERGKKAKLAASKIKELFGTSWQVEPLKIPN